MINFSLVQTKDDFSNYINTHTNFDIENQTEDLIQCLARTVFYRQYYVYGKADVYEGVNNLISQNINMMGMFRGETKEKAEKELNFYQKLQPYLFPEPIDFSATRQVFLNANTYNVAIESMKYSNKRIESITCDQAMKYGIEEGLKLTKMDLSLFIGMVDNELFKQFLEVSSNIKIFRTSAEHESIKENFVGLIADNLRHLEEFKIYKRYIKPEEYEKFAELTELRCAEFSCCTFGSNALKEFAKLPKLEILHINAKTNGGYGGYSGSLADEDLEYLKIYPALKEIDLTNHYDISDKAIEDLQKCLPDLKIIR